jgi:hypothetical protein
MSHRRHRSNVLTFDRFMIDTGSISDETDLLAVTSELFDRETVMPDYPTH